MATAQTSEALFAHIERSGLLPAGRVREYAHAPGADGPNGAVEVARALVRDRLLTPFQARQLLRGKTRGFFLTDKYKVLEPLGEGGMGHVYLCEHLLLHKLMAVKLLHSNWVSVPGAEERFLREARAAAAVEHQNLVRVFDVDRSGGAPFMVMEFVDGKNLHQLVADHGPLSPVRAAEYVRQTAVGLNAVHKAGLIHRDIKPGNLLLDRSGAVKILDLGLARFLVDSARNNNLTQKFDPGAVLGTLDFIAPEQADNSSTADIRADIYSLGHTLYYLLTGRLPFGDGSAAQKLIWHQLRYPEPLGEARPDAPAGLVAVFEKMTAKAPADRFQTPAEVVAALRPLAPGPVAPPAADEMPKMRANAFLIGLSDPPRPEMLATADPATPKATGAETVLVRRGSGSAPPRPPDQSDSDVLHASATPDELVRQIPTPTGVPVAPRARKLSPAVLAALGAVAVAGLTGGALAVWKLTRPADAPAPPVAGGPDDRGPADPRPERHEVAAVFTGEGSSFIDPVMQRWIAGYREKTGRTFGYRKSGSGAGVREFLSKRVTFGATDAPLTDAQLQEAESVGGPALHVPLALGPVVVAYNLPGAKQQVKLTGKALADIYLGKITRWDHKAIQAHNPFQLPPLPITVVRRGDSSGTTDIWTDYLSQVSDEWKSGPGRGNLVKWPVGEEAKQNDGVARLVGKTEGAVGYTELTYANGQNLAVAEVENSEGAFVAPTPAAVTAAAASRLKDVPPDLRYSLANAPGAASYPIAGTTWAVLFRKQRGPEGRELVSFLRWAVRDGQKRLPDGYAPLPPELVARIEKALDTVTFDK